MFTALLTLLCIAIVVTSLLFLYFKFVKIKDSTARYFEICGYGILLVLLIWEFGIKDIVMNEFYNLDFWMIGEKLNYIFMGIQRIPLGSSMDTLKSAYSDIGRGTEYVNQQMLFIDVAELVMQILSTAFIAVGRFQELKNKKQ